MRNGRPVRVPTLRVGPQPRKERGARLMDLLLMWPGRCADCGKIWWGACYHPIDEENLPGHFTSRRTQVVLSRAKSFWLGVASGVLATGLLFFLAGMVL